MKGVTSTTGFSLAQLLGDHYGIRYGNPQTSSLILRRWPTISVEFHGEFESSRIIFGLMSWRNGIWFR